MRIKDLQLSKNNYYNPEISEVLWNTEDELGLALGSLKNEGFHVRCLENYIVENNVKNSRVIEHFFFCNNKQIRFACQFESDFLIETDATFNTNRLNLPLSTLIGITNTAQTFPVAHCYITSKSTGSFISIFECLKDLIFHDKCLGPVGYLGWFCRRI